VPKDTHVVAAKVNPDLQTKLGLVVRRWRQQLGITQEELAWRADLHRTYIADIERGARNVTLQSIASLAKALQLTIGDLLSHATTPAGTAMRLRAKTTPKTVPEILLIEDSATDAAMAARAFKRAKVTNPLKIVCSAEDGLDYLFGSSRKGQRARPQLILLDLNLPQMSGLEFLRRIKSDERTRDIPVVILTVSQSDRMIIECGRLGAVNYIVKPFGIENFVRVTPKLNLHLTVGPPANVRSRPS
jgi:CheY-like chemotaxis protein/DNA-binding XRE family transcriptional regulator